MNAAIQNERKSRLCSGNQGEPWRRSRLDNWGAFCIGYTMPTQADVHQGQLPRFQPTKWTLSPKMQANPGTDPKTRGQTPSITLLAIELGSVPVVFACNRIGVCPRACLQIGACRQKSRLAGAPKLIDTLDPIGLESTPPRSGSKSNSVPSGFLGPGFRAAGSNLGARFRERRCRNESS